MALTRSSSPLVVVTVVVTSRSSGRVSLVTPCTVPRASSISRPSLTIGRASSATNATNATAAIRPATSPTDIRRFPPRVARRRDGGRRPGGPGAGSALNPTRAAVVDSPAAQHAAQSFQPCPDVALGTTVRGLVVAAVDQRVRQVLLLGHAVRRVVRVLVALAVTERLGAGVVGVPEVRGHRPGQPGPHVRRRGVDPEVGG